MPQRTKPPARERRERAGHSPAAVIAERSAAEGDQHGLVHLERLPARPGRTADLRLPLRHDVWAALGVEHLWSHQAAAVDLARDGHSVAVATGTASGKSLCYQAPIAEAVTGPDLATALLLFPTKALAHDQLRALGDLGLPELVAGCYDGDAGHEERAWIRQHVNVLLSNPEMLHHGILPNHPRWATFLGRLRYVVVDELHVHRGVFGSHVAHLLRRLRRLCGRYGSDPTFIFSSATIGDPGRLATDLCGLPVAEVVEDGSPAGERSFALWNPPTDEHGRRASANRESAALLADLVTGGHRVIAFCRSRKGTEIVAADARRRLDDDLDRRVRSYRGGYLADERRQIEQQLADGELDAVVATTALELGIDIGGLDACVLNGFPGTIASMWQQAGRAGRDLQPSLAVLVAGDDQLDQWLMAHPTEVFRRPPEPAVVNAANPYVLLPHLACAAHEMPLSLADRDLWGDLLEDGVRDLVRGDLLRVRRPDPDAGGPATTSPTAVWNGVGVPGQGVSLRSGGGRELRITTQSGELIGTVDRARAPSLVHTGAIYLHQGDAWHVTGLDLDGGIASVEPHDGDEYTQATTETEIRILATDATKRVGHSSLSLGEVEVASQVVGYRRRSVQTGDLIETGELDLPPSQMVTRAFWYTISPTVLGAAELDEPRWPGTLHAVEHAAIGMLPLFTICDRWDVGGVSTALQADTGLPSVFVYDGYAGGAGIAELGYARADEHLRATLEVITACRCESGCPSCVQSPKCGNGNEPLDKEGAVALVRAVLHESVAAAATTRPPRPTRERPGAAA